MSNQNFKVTKKQRKKDEKSRVCVYTIFELFSLPGSPFNNNNMFNVIPQVVGSGEGKVYADFTPISWEVERLLTLDFVWYDNTLMTVFGISSSTLTHFELLKILDLTS